MEEAHRLRVGSDSLEKVAEQGRVRCPEEADHHVSRVSGFHEQIPEVSTVYAARDLGGVRAAWARRASMATSAPGARRQSRRYLAP